MKIDFKSLAKVKKAVVGFVAPAAVVLTGAVLAGSDGGTSITQGEIVTAVCACFITGYGVYKVRNKPSGDSN